MASVSAKRKPRPLRPTQSTHQPVHVPTPRRQTRSLNAPKSAHAELPEEDEAESEQESDWEEEFQCDLARISVGHTHPDKLC